MLKANSYWKRRKVKQLARSRKGRESTMTEHQDNNRYPSWSEACALWGQHLEELQNREKVGGIRALATHPACDFKGVVLYADCRYFTQRGELVHEFLELRGPSRSSKELVRHWQKGGDGELHILVPRWRNGAWVLKNTKKVVAGIDEYDEVDGNK